MTDQNILLKHGAFTPTQLSVDLSANTSIVNSDSVNSIWVSNSPSMTSGVGTRIGPLGSGKWVDHGNAYAICDAAATTDVTIRLTDSMVDLTDPVAVGVAVATQLLVTGVKSVLIDEPIVTGVSLVRGSGGNNAFSILYDVSQYSSVLLDVHFLPPMQTMVWYYFSDTNVPAGGVEATGDYWTTGNQRIPVRGKYLCIANGSQTTDTTFSLVGTNRSTYGVMDENTNQFANFPITYAAPSQAWVVGGQTIINPSFAGLVGLTPNPTGECFLTASFSTGTAARGIINCQYYGGDGVLHSVPLCDTGEAHLDWTSGAMFVYKLVALPNCPYVISFQPRVAGTSAVTVTLTRAQAP